MAPKVLEINSLLDTLQDEDYNTVISFIKFLSAFCFFIEVERTFMYVITVV